MSLVEPRNPRLLLLRLLRGTILGNERTALVATEDDVAIGFRVSF